MPMGLAGAAGVGYLKQNSPEGPLCIALAEWYIGKTLFMVVGAMLRPLRTLCVVTKKPALGGLEKVQALRNFLMPTRDNKPAMMPSSHSGLVGTGGFTGTVADCEV